MDAQPDRASGRVPRQWGVAMRTDCKHYESRTYQSGDVVRKCRIDLAPEAPWKCPDQCPGYERKMIDAGWVYGSLGHAQAAARRAACRSATTSPRLLDEAEEIVNAAGADLRDEQARQDRKRFFRKQAQAALNAAVRWSARRLPRARTRSGHRAIEAMWIAVVFWSANALFVRAGDADPLVFTTWRLWLALPPLTLVLCVADAARRRGHVARAGCLARPVGAARVRRGRVLRVRRRRPRSSRSTRRASSTSR